MQLTCSNSGARSMEITVLGRRGLGLFAELGGGCSFVFDIYSFAVCVRCGANHSEGGNNGIYFLICRGDMAVICK